MYSLSAQIQLLCTLYYLCIWHVLRVHYKLVNNSLQVYSMVKNTLQTDMNLVSMCHNTDCSLWPKLYLSYIIIESKSSSLLSKKTETIFFLLMQVAFERKGVRVNCICPATVSTSLVEATIDQYKASVEKYGILS